MKTKWSLDNKISYLSNKREIDYLELGVFVGIVLMGIILFISLI